MIPIGYVGVVVSYYGSAGHDVTGESFRYGEQVDPGHRGVWKQALPPGKYALNPYALKVELVPTVNFVLRWITGQVESHHYDEDLETNASLLLSEHAGVNIAENKPNVEELEKFSRQIVEKKEAEAPAQSPGH